MKRYLREDPWMKAKENVKKLIKNYNKDNLL